MKNKYRNPWAKKTNIAGPEFYENNGVKVGEHRGVVCFKIHERGWDYVLAGVCIAQRGGFSPEALDEILDGARPISDEVSTHLRACGFAPMTYEEASAIDRCERDGFMSPPRNSPEFAKMVAHYATK